MLRIQVFLQNFPKRTQAWSAFAYDANSQQEEIGKTADASLLTLIKASSVFPDRHMWITKLTAEGHEIAKKN